MNILVIGAEGYIGYAIARTLLDNGHTVVLFSEKPSAPFHISISEYIGDIENTAVLQKICVQHSIECIVYSKIFIHDFVKKNVSGIESILHVMNALAIKKMLLISSASVYGIPKTEKVEEKQALSPLTTLSESLVMMEQKAEVFAMQNDDYTITTLRLFSVAGADSERNIGPSPTSTNFMPTLMRSFASKKIKFVFFGDDYATADGYAFRDFIHINDVCDAVGIAVENFENQGIPYIEYNIGSGEGATLKDIVNRASELLQMSIHTTAGSRRDGDVARLVANITRAKLLLNWAPRYPLDQCIITTWHWMMRQF